MLYKNRKKITFAVRRLLISLWFISTLLAKSLSIHTVFKLYHVRETAFPTDFLIAEFIKKLSLFPRRAPSNSQPPHSKNFNPFIFYCDLVWGKISSFHPYIFVIFFSPACVKGKAELSFLFVATLIYLLFTVAFRLIALAIICTIPHELRLDHRYNSIKCNFPRFFI